MRAIESRRACGTATTYGKGRHPHAPTGSDAKAFAGGQLTRTPRGAVWERRGGLATVCASSLFFVRLAPSNIFPATRDLSQARNGAVTAVPAAEGCLEKHSTLLVCLPTQRSRQCPTVLAPPAAAERSCGSGGRFRVPTATEPAFLEQVFCAMTTTLQESARADGVQQAMPPSPLRQAHRPPSPPLHRRSAGRSAGE